ncbi:uncharacterized protein [Littorina saxatilis]|uniref:uncharacterized protein n=1 Tax=Littorina saxatilis TaxID=31220 RepID=UPI0038B43E13
MRNFWLTPLVAVLVMALVTGVTCNCPYKSATLLTYNAGLTPTVYGYDERRSPVMTAIKTKGADVDFMCLQEFWYEEDVKNVVESLESEFPYHYSAIHSDVGQLRSDRKKRFPGRNTVPCSVGGLTKLSACLAVNCLQANDQRECMTTNCQNSLYSLSPECRSCVTASSSGMTKIWSRCTTATQKYNRMNRPGLVVLSKQPLSSVEYVNFFEGEKVLLERGYIRAQVGNNPSYVCTHLTSVFPTYYEARLPQFSNYTEQQAAEIAKLNVKFSGTPHVLLGDLNTGPARNSTPGATVLGGEVPAHYDNLTGLGYQNPYLLNNGNCTYCPSESQVLRVQNTVYPDLAIDHVLTNGVDSDTSSAKRVLDAAGKLLSDHFGVQVDVCLP